MIRAALTAVLAIAPALAAAQYPPPQPYPGEHAQDRHEMRQDRRELRDDRRDLAWYRDLLARYDSARTRRDRFALRAIEDEVSSALARELRESRVELARSEREVRQEWREGDRQGMNDDLRDRHDDRRDLRRIAAIDREFTSLRGRMDRRGLERKRTLIVELNRLAQAELREDHRERREDRRDYYAR
jgi:hypothetical protein